MASPCRKGLQVHGLGQVEEMSVGPSREGWPGPEQRCWLLGTQYEVFDLQLSGESEQRATCPRHVWKYRRTSAVLMVD